MFSANQIAEVLNFNISKTIGGIKFIFACRYISIKARNWRCNFPWVGSGIPRHILKVTKFLVKISQFEFLGMTVKNIFVYNLFLFSLKFRVEFILNVKISSFPWKTSPPPSPPPFPAPPLRIELRSCQAPQWLIPSLKSVAYQVY